MRGWKSRETNLSRSSLWGTLSKAFLRSKNIEDLWIGTTEDTFQGDGKQPVLIDWLNNNVKDGAMLYTVNFNIFAEIPSGPLAFDVSSCWNKETMSSSVQRSSSKINWSLPTNRNPPEGIQSHWNKLRRSHSEAWPYQHPTQWWFIYIDGVKME